MTRPGNADRFDEDYYRGNGQLGDRPALRFYVRLVRRYVGPGPYLDFGCGTGHLVRRLGQLDRSAGFEISEYSAAAARRNAPASQIVTDPAELPAHSFGGITAIHVLEHLPDEVAASAIAEWRRVLRPGGRALLVMPDPAGRARRLAQERWSGFSDDTHINLKPHAQWRAFLAAHGLRVLREGSDGMWNVPYRSRFAVVDGLRYAGPALAQYLAGRLLLAPGTGESSIFVVESL